MRKSLLRFFGTYLLFVVLFVLQKVVFMLYYHNLYDSLNLSGYLDVIWHGLVLDFSTAGYFTILPGLLLIASLWLLPHIINPVFKFYYAVMSSLLSIVFVADLVLYDYWGFRLDSTPFFYFLSSPADAFASVSNMLVVAGFVVVVALAWLFYQLFTRLLVDKKPDAKVFRRRGRTSLVLLLLTALLFIPIRGGFTVSTMNIGQAYFSNDMKINHATINPCFSLLESLMREKNFNDQYRFMSPEEADKEFATLVDRPLGADSLSTDTVPALFATKRPDIIFVVLESFMSPTMETLGGAPGIAVNMDRFAREGILFTNFYANSFRTDRGLVSIFSGYPAQPTTSIMKYPKMSQSLPSIPRSLKDAGYNVDYYYGGDANFTNMRSYLMAMGIDKLVSDVDFPVSERLSKWGAHDHVVFNRLSADLRQEQKEPFMKIVQTSSSHEPYKVPFSKLSDEFFNSVAYTDSCLGDFIDKYKETKWWKNSIVVLVPDHARRHPETMKDLSVERYQIPLVITGGALLNDSVKIDTYASQIDIAATLLGQLGLPHEEFTFSKNVLNPSSPHFGYFTFPNAFGMITKENAVIYDCDLEKSILDTGSHPGANLNKGKAFLQKLYDDLGKR